MDNTAFEKKETTIINTLDQYKKWSHDFINTLIQGQTATILCLSGEVGVGKTTLAQYIGGYLGITESITSPTFVIQKEYLVSHHLWIKKLVHIDAYRLANKSELEYLGWNDLVMDPHTLVIVEWPELVTGIVMDNSINLDIHIQDDHSRLISLYKTTKVQPS